MNIREALQYVVRGQSLTEEAMEAVMNQIMEGLSTDAQTAALLTALRMKGETVPEICGAAKAMRARALSIHVDHSGPLVDIVGTGGDGARTFNISTASALVASGAGIMVAKHGNRSVSSSCGSADVLESLGIKIDISPQAMADCISRAGIGFLFAPILHRAMKYAAPARKAIGIRTLFNILGPLTNPADADVQVIGVYDECLTGLLARVSRQLGRKRVMVVHGRDGLDEISLQDETAVCELKDNNISSYVLTPEDASLPRALSSDVQGGTPAENAAIITSVLEGEKGPCRDIVCLNAAAAIVAAGSAHDFKGGVCIAQQSIDSGSAMDKLNQLRTLTRTAS